MSAEEKRAHYSAIVKQIYAVLAKYSAGIEEKDWDTIYATREKFDLNDPFVKDMWIATYTELARQYRQQSA